MSKLIDKYLSRYAEKESAHLEALKDHPNWDAVVVVPLCGESIDRIYSLLQSLTHAAHQAKEKLCIIWVLNESPQSMDHYKKRNHTFLTAYTEVLGGTLLSKDSNIFMAEHSPGVESLLINLTTQWAISSGGVGLARKVGCDCALFLSHHNKVSRPYFWTTDGDAVVPEDYFLQVKDFDERSAAYLYQFVHLLEKEEPLTQKACHYYENYLHYYVEGLKKAKSPFAYHTIGSTFALSFNHYAQVRGFPKREAGEDFHLLNKLAQVGNIHSLTGLPIKLAARASQRVPFGTGASVIQIRDTLSKDEPYEIYHPSCFDSLRYLNEALVFLSEHGEIDIFREELTLAAPPLDTIFYQLVSEGQLHQTISNRTNSKDRLKAIYTLFDSLKTLRFIHEVRDHYFSTLPYSPQVSSRASL